MVIDPGMFAVLKEEDLQELWEVKRSGTDLRTYLTSSV